MSARRAAAWLLAACLATGAAAGAHAASLPDWAKEIAAAAPAIGDATPRYSARILLYERSAVFDDDGSVRMRVRIAKQVLSVRDGSVGFGRFAFTDSGKMKVSRAWHVPPGEKIEKSDATQQIDIRLSSDFVTDAKMRAVAIEHMRRGSLVFFEFEAVETPLTLSFAFEVDRELPLDLWRVAIEVPAGWTLHGTWQRGTGAPPAERGNVSTWEARDVVPVEDEPLAVPEAEQEPRLTVRIGPPAGAKTPPAFVTWDDLGRWYTGLGAGRDAAGPEIEAAARSCGAADAPWVERVRCASRTVRDRVRYVAREVGIGGYQPHAAQETFSRLHGDCKDKATLLRSFLAVVGIRAYPVLVHSTEDGTVADDVPSATAFNHVILAVPVPAGTALPPEFDGALADAGRFGRVLLVDVTAESVAFGTLGGSLAGHRGLVMDDQGGVLVTVPVPPPHVNRIERQVAVKGRGDGTADFESRTRYVGEPAARERAEWRQSEKDYRTAVENAIRARHLGAHVEDVTLESETPDGAFLATARWSAPLPAQPDGKLELLLFPGAEGFLPRVALSRRKTAVRYMVPRTLEIRTTVENLAAGALPEPESLAGERWSVETSVAREGAAVRARWTTRLTARDFPADALGDLKKLNAAISNTAGLLLVVSR